MILQLYKKTICKLYNVTCCMYVCMYVYTVFIHIKAGLKYMQGLKYMPGRAAE